MKCGGEVTGISRAIDESALRSTFVGICGMTDEGAYNATRAGFEDLLTLPRHQQLLDQMEQAGTSSGLTDLYKRFLIDGGNCPRQSLSTELQRSTSMILAQNTSADRYTIWSNLLESLSEAAKGLFAAVGEVKHANILLYAQRLDMLFDKVASIAAFYEERVLMNTNSPLEDVIVFLQSNMAEPLRRHVSNILEKVQAYDPTGMTEIGVANASVDLKAAWDEFNSPFGHIALIASFLEQHRTGLRISLDNMDAVPLLKPVDPQALKDVINKTILFAAQYGNRLHPVKMKFGWNDKSSEIEITFKNLWASMESDWMGLVFDLGGYTTKWRQEQTSTTGHTIFIPVELAEKIRNGSSGSGGAAPAPAGGTQAGGTVIEGMAAAWETSSTQPHFFEYTSQPMPDTFFAVNPFAVIGGTNPYPVFAAAPVTYMSFAGLSPIF